MISSNVFHCIPFSLLFSASCICCLALAWMTSVLVIRLVPALGFSSSMDAWLYAA